jgi:hypothetical protein
MSPLEQLFRLEIEFHRRLRTEAPGSGYISGLHTSYALQSGYVPLVQSIESVSSSELSTLRDRLTLEGDPRDVLAACDSLRRLLGIRLVEP